MSWSHTATGTAAEVSQALNAEFEKTQAYLDDPEKHVHARVIHLIHVALAETKGYNVTVNASGHQSKVYGDDPASPAVGHTIRIDIEPLSVAVAEAVLDAPTNTNKPKRSRANKAE